MDMQTNPPVSMTAMFARKCVNVIGGKWIAPKGARYFVGSPREQEGSA